MEHIDLSKHLAPLYSSYNNIIKPLIAEIYIGQKASFELTS